MIKYLLALLLIPSVVCAGTISGGSGASGSIVSAAAATGVMSAGTPSTEQKMIAHWQFEDSLVDTTSVTGFLTATGSPSYSYDSPIAGASSIYLNGSNQYLSIAYADLSNYAPFKGASNDFTICGMFEGQRVDNVHYVFALFDMGEDERKIGIGLNTNQAMFVVHGNATGTTNESDVHGSSYGIGVRVAFVYSESASTGNYTLDIYNINAGAYLGTQLSGTWGNTYNSSDQPDLTIGTRPGSGLYLTGLVDEVRVYNKILNSTEKAEYYAFASSDWPTEPDYGTLFATGFEGVALAAAGLQLQYFNDDGLNTCKRNVTYCTVGDLDSATGYNVPADMPGKWFVAGESQPVWNNGCPTCSQWIENSITTTAGQFFSGSAALYTNGVYEYYPGTSLTSRNMLNVYRSDSGEEYDNLKETMMRVKLKIGTASYPSAPWSVLIQEWASGSNPARLLLRADLVNGVYALYQSGGTNCTLAEKCLNNYSAAFPVNEWVEMIVYHKFSLSTDGRIVWKWKAEGESEVTVLDHTGRTAYGSTLLDVWNPIKRYQFSQFDDIPFYWDDFTIFDPALVNPTNGLPAWTIDD